MVQLIIQGIRLPETRSEKYKCYRKSTDETIAMISGRLVTEVGYSRRIIEYSLDNNQFLSSEASNLLLAALENSADLDVLFLAPGSAELQRSIFKCTKAPVTGHIQDDIWRLSAFTLEEANPSA